MALKNEQRKRVADYAHELGLEFFSGRTLAPGDRRRPPLRHPERAGCRRCGAAYCQRRAAGGRGANMPSSAAAIRLFHEAKVLFAPGKAANAGGLPPRASR